jgi:hypothetical protein
MTSIDIDEGSTNNAESPRYDSSPPVEKRLNVVDPLETAPAASILTVLNHFLAD